MYGCNTGLIAAWLRSQQKKVLCFLFFLRFTHFTSLGDLFRLYKYSYFPYIKGADV